LPSDLWASPTWQAVIDENMVSMGQRPTEAFLHQPAEALFDVQADPVEAVNLIDDPALQDVTEQMRTKVRQFRMATDDPWGLASRQMGEAGLTGGVS
jgi:N-sulfoglucosamine sulfohydrolase